MGGFAEYTVSARVQWASGLFTLRLAGESPAHEPGQFANLALSIDGELTRRSYSIASAPGAPLEFFLTRVERGVLSPRLDALRVGDQLLVEQQAHGFFTLAHVPPASELWMVATGTGLGPFVSMLRSAEPWRRFERIVLVHGVRTAAELAYRDELLAFEAERAGQFVQVPVLSRQSGVDGALEGRVTSCLATGGLEARAGLALSSARSHVLLCGNPQMIGEMCEQLAARGLNKHRTRKPGHVSFEKYW